MKATETLHDRGQSLWLDNITRDLLETGTLKRYIDELSVTGLTSNPTIFDHAIKNSTAYDAAIREKLMIEQIKAGCDLEVVGASMRKLLRWRLPQEPTSWWQEARFLVKAKEW